MKQSLTPTEMPTEPSRKASTRRKIIGVCLVIGMAVGLHSAFRGLAIELPQLFPRLAKEKREYIAMPITLTDEEIPTVVETAYDDPAPPEGAIPMKRAGEELLSLGAEESLLAAKNDGRYGRLGRRLVTATPIPELSGPARPVSEAFDIPPELEPIVNFWKKIYGVYGTDRVVLHDMERLEIEYGVLDFSDLDRREITDSEKKKIRNSEINEGMARIKRILGELDEWDGASPLSRDAKRIAALFRHIGQPNKYKAAKERVRAQTGLKGRFATAVRRSGRYLPLFEEIFQSYGVPREITRLSFVESLFKEKAYSKVGAAGLWQFMPETARRYMTVDKLVDERYDPIMATHAAARLLLRNRDLLGTWPLAINAYNSGPGNLLKAIAKLGTKEIGTIVTRYKTGSYAFASRNFYPSFLAALTVYENRESFFGRIHQDPVMRFHQVEVPTTMSFPEIAFLSNVTLGELKELNPAYSPEVFEGDYSIPPGTRVRVPEGGHQAFASRFVQYYTGGSPSFHVVTRGESLREIASQYGLSPQDLQRINTPGKLEAGRVLMIPSSSSLVRN